MATSAEIDYSRQLVSHRVIVDFQRFTAYLEWILIMAELEVIICGVQPERAYGVGGKLIQLKHVCNGVKEPNIYIYIVFSL